jgi:hypothetical protein
VPLCRPVWRRGVSPVWGIGTAAGALARRRRLSSPVLDKGSMHKSPEDRLTPIAAARLNIERFERHRERIHSERRSSTGVVRDGPHRLPRAPAGQLSPVFKRGRRPSPASGPIGTQGRSRTYRRGGRK